MAEKVRRSNGWEIRWGKSRQTGKYAGRELFEGESFADRFRALVERAGNDWPPGWVPGVGFETQSSEPSAGTPFLDYALMRTEELRKARSIGADSYRKYRSYAHAFAGQVATARRLAQVLAEDEELREAFLEDHAAALPLVETLAAANGDHPELVVEEIDRHTIAAWVDYMRATGRSPKTIRNYHGFLHGVFQEALEDDLIGRNPCASTKLAPAEPTRPKVVLEPHEFWLIHAAMHPDMRGFIEVAVGTGARFGELTALTVADWAPAQRTLTINKAWKRAMAGLAVGKPKTSAGNRVVYVGVGLAATVDKHCAGKAPDDLIFTAARGGPIRNQAFSEDRWRPAVVQARSWGLTKSPVFHDLRHTHVSWLRDANVPGPAISDLVGHAGPSMTERYGGATQEAIERATAAIESRLRGS